MFVDVLLLLELPVRREDGHIATDVGFKTKLGAPPPLGSKMLYFMQRSTMGSERCIP
jgi:hypothetical protein